MGSFIVLKNSPNEQTNVCNPRSCGEISVCRLFAGVCLFAQNIDVSFGGLKMSLQTVFKCPAKLYTLKIFTHNRNRGQVQEHSDRGGVLFFHALKNIMKGVLI